MSCQHQEIISYEGVWCSHTAHPGFHIGPLLVCSTAICGAFWALTRVTLICRTDQNNEKNQMKTDHICTVPLLPSPSLSPLLWKPSTHNVVGTIQECKPLQIGRVRGRNISEKPQVMHEGVTIKIQFHEEIFRWQSKKAFSPLKFPWYTIPTFNLNKTFIQCSI